MNPEQQQAIDEITRRLTACGIPWSTRHDRYTEGGPVIAVEYVLFSPQFGEQPQVRMVWPDGFVF